MYVKDPSIGKVSNQSALVVIGVKYDGGSVELCHTEVRREDVYEADDESWEESERWDGKLVAPLEAPGASLVEGYGLEVVELKWLLGEEAGDEALARAHKSMKNSKFFK